MARRERIACLIEKGKAEKATLFYKEKNMESEAEFSTGQCTLAGLRSSNNLSKLLLMVAPFFFVICRCLYNFPFGCR